MSFNIGEKNSKFVTVRKQIESVSNAFRTLNGDENTPFTEGRG